jgi:murein DD-endopeptidase MepM/ murein hydrolase activator NlpD
VYAGSGAGYGPAYGIHVVVWAGDSFDLYAHLSEELVIVGQSVN